MCVGCGDGSGVVDTRLSDTNVSGHRTHGPDTAPPEISPSEISTTPESFNGERLFTAYCLACHGGDGHGSHAAPPLVGSPWAAGPPSRVVRIILNGVRGPIEVGGGLTFNREMPGFGRALTDTQIAGLVTYVRNAFGRSVGAITSEDVAGIRSATRDRTSYWSAEELLAVPLFESQR